VKRSFVVAAVVAALVAGIAHAALPPDPRAAEAVGELRVLVIRATWGPRPDASGDFAGAKALYSRASFGRLHLKIDITPWLQAYPEPSCPGEASSRSVFGAFGDRAQDAAIAAGYDVGTYRRLVYILPERMCNVAGLGVGREVFMAQDGGVLDDHAFVHELGHTFGLPHAGGSSCARGCRIFEYGDSLSPMGSGGVDFTALEKLKLGWISAVQRVDRSGTYQVANIDEPSLAPQALVVPTAAGEYWVEHRASEPGRVIVRLVRPNDALHPVYLRSVLLAQAEQRYVARGVFSVTRRFEFRWLDTKRPTMPRVRALDHAWLSWARSSDAGSGVAGYRVSIDGKLLATTAVTGTALPPLRPGGHRVTVVTVDRAGNRSRPGVVSLNV
jgi:gametolysin peptidase M11